MPVLTFPRKFWKKSASKKKFPYRIALDKRAKFAIGTVFLAAIFLYGNLTPGPVFKKAILLGLFCSLSLILSLVREIKRPGFFLILILPTFFSVFSFCFVKGLTLPLFMKVLSPLFFGLGTYSIFLIANIFSICLEKMIPLFRAALAVGFLFTVITSLVAFSYVLFLRLSFWQNGLLISLISFFLVIQALWSVNPKQEIGRRLLVLGFVISLVMGELAVAVSFWPVVPILGALFLASVLYALVGIHQLRLSERLNKQRIIEYTSIAAVVLVLMIIATRWG